MMQVQVLATLVTLNAVPLNQRGTQAAAAVVTAVPALLREAQQYWPGHESVVPVAVAVHAAVKAVATVTLLEGAVVNDC